MPFISDHLWGQLTEGMGLAESVHLSDWPSVREPDNASQKVLGEMKKVRKFIAEGLAKRADAGIKVRQPLNSVTIPEIEEVYKPIIADELNVKDVLFIKSPTTGLKPPRTLEDVGSKVPLEVSVADKINISENVTVDTNLTDELKAEGIARELIRHIQSARKKANFNVEDRIKLRLESASPDTTEAIERFRDTIYSETLATAELGQGEQPEYTKTVKVDGQEVIIALTR